MYNKEKLHGKYIYYGTSSKGVNRKINDQIAYFNNFFNVAEVVIRPQKRTFLKRVLSLLPWVSAGQDYNSISDDINKSDFLYIRRNTFDISLYKFLASLKKINPKCLVIIEIPTYPYFRDTYAHSFIHFIRNFHLLIKDLIYRKKINRFVDYFAVFGKQDKVFSVKTIKINNGANINNISKRIPNDNMKDKIISIIAVAHMAPHSGYERLIRGLKDYYSRDYNYIIKVYIIGDGSERRRYERLIRKYKLENFISLVGRLDGNMIDEYYNSADIAVASLGLYKYKIQIGNFLKISEYLAKGLPIITGSDIGLFLDHPFEFELKFENNSKSIDILRVVDFLEKIRGRYECDQINDLIRRYAIINSDVSQTYEPIIKTINEYFGEQNE